MSRTNRDGNRGNFEKELAGFELFGGDLEVVGEVLESAEPVDLGLDDILIGGGRGERDLFLILSGSLAVRVDGRVVARHGRGSYVGEMALIDAGTKRTATVVAMDRSVVLRIDEPSFTRVANRHPVLWRSLAIEMVRRLAKLQAKYLETRG